MKELKNKKLVLAAIAREMNFWYDVSLKTDSEITKEEAQAADFVIIASDQKIVGMDRFEGKKVIRVDINICIKAPEAVLKKCVAAVSK